MSRSPFWFLLLLLPALAHALPRDPAVSRTHVAFVEGGQVWVMARGATIATRLTDSPGGKFTPRFSPDGGSLAFAANDAQGQANLQVISVRGGTPAQRTFLPFHQVLCQWTGDGSLLFHTNALSFSSIEMQLFRVPATGGQPVQLPLAYGSDGAVDPTGEWLAYTPQWPNPLIASWKRYRGGAAPDLWLFNLRTRESRKITDWQGADLHPMWHGTTLYYLSDEGAEGRLNLWSYDTRTRTRRQATRFRDHDVHNPSIGPDAIVFEFGPGLQLFDLRSGKASPLDVRIPEKGRSALRRKVDASRFVTHRQDAGFGRVLLEARGDLWLAGSGAEPPRNLTATSGAFEREASVSPDGRTVAYWSDATDEYQLYIRDFAGPAPITPLTSFVDGFRTRPLWSPDSRRLAFSDQTGAITLYDVATSRLTRADVEPWAEPTELAWSPDGTWLAYTRTGHNRLTAIWRYEAATGERRQLTSGAFNASTPVFDPKGERMFFLSYRNFGNPVTDWMQQRIAHRATSVLMAVPLSGVTFEADAFERSASRVALSAGAVTALGATRDGDPIYGLTDLGGASSVRVYDLRAGKERVVLSGSGDFVLSADGRHLILERDGKTLVGALADSTEAPIRTDGMIASVDLAAEWRQIFDDAWRLYRDFFHAPKAPLVDWPQVKARYAPMLARCVTREEVNLVLGEMIGESSVGHAYIGHSGDVAPAPAGPAAALLGADFRFEDGAFRIARIREGAAWDDAVRSPLRAAVEGEYLLAVEGAPLDETKDPYQALLGRAGKEVRLTVGPHPTRDASAREIVVTPLPNERELRRRSWVESNRRRVAEASGGRIGYAHISDFTTNGMNDFVRQYYGQIDKEALVIDARWSLGGWTGAHLAELLARAPLNYAAGRFTEEAWPAPRWGAHFGAKVLIVNHITVSAGENFALYFRKLGLGPIVGARTWGGLTGLNPVPALIDGGAVNVPNAPFYDESGWLIEGHGLAPDRLVEWDPARPEDPQLEAAITEMLAAIAKPYRAPGPP
jgi:tricorn protease